MQKLPCLSPEDYAAYALYMKCLADTLEDKFTAINDQFSAFRRRYAGVWRNTVPIVSDGSGNFVTTNVANLHWNDPVNPPSDGTGAVGDPIRYNFPGNVEDGLYEVGGTVFFNAGATSGSLRQMEFPVYYTSTIGIVSNVVTLDTSEESLSGGESLNCSAQLPISNQEVPADSNNFGVPIGFTVTLTEADAGAITIPAGGLTFWAVFIGTNNLIGGF